MSFCLRRVRAVFATVWVAAITLSASNSAQGYWKLVWNDEFNNNNLDTTHWTYDVGNGFTSGGVFVSGWGNNELEFYTRRSDNVTVNNGVVHIIARREPYLGFSYTSGRIKTAGLFYKTYGRFEFRAKLPKGLGFWPALWLLPQNWKYGDWPASGEIDVMENAGSETTRILASVHYGSVSNPAKTQWSYSFPSSTTTNFHIYAMEWSTNSIKMFFDGKLFGVLSTWWSGGGPFPAPYDQPFHILMNVAVGGDFVGNPSTNVINANTVFPGEMQVDYVRVYDYSPTPVPGLQITETRAGIGELYLAGGNGPPHGTFFIVQSTNAMQAMNYWRRVSTNEFDARGSFSSRIPINSEAGLYRLQVP